MPGIDPLTYHIWHDDFVSTTSYTIYRAPAEYLTDKHDAIPEPSTLALLGIGIIRLIGYGWRRGRRRERDRSRLSPCIPSAMNRLQKKAIPAAIRLLQTKLTQPQGTSVAVKA